MSTGSSSNSAEADHAHDHPHGVKKPVNYFHPTQISPPVRSPLDWSLTSDPDLSETSSLHSAPGSSRDQRTVLKYAHITNEYIRLSEVLDSMDPVQIKDNLQQRLVKNDPKAIVAMSILFPRMNFPFVHNIHCVRCHSNYNPRDDCTPCRVPHPMDLVISVGSDPQGVINYYCKSCRQGFKLLQPYDLDCDVTQTGVCFYGKHTSNARDVKYKGAIRTCEDRGCQEYYV